MDKPKIVILGGGFGGVRCALDLVSHLGGRCSVTLIDKDSYHFFTPSLYEIASAFHVQDDPYAMQLRKAVAVPYSEIFAGKPVEVVQAEVTGVEFQTKRVLIESGRHISFDYLVLALGSQSSDFGIPGVNEYAFHFKTPDDAIALNQKMEELFRDVAARQTYAPVHIMLIGAGFTGIELAAELVMYARRIIKLIRLNPRSFKLTLFEAAPKVLPMVDDDERNLIVHRLTELGVVIMAGSAIESVTANSVKLKNGQTVTGDAVVWTAGVRPNQLVESIHNLPNEKGKVLVDEFLRVGSFHNVFALGDLLHFIDQKTQRPIPGLAYTAQAQGQLIAKNIIADMSGRKLAKYNPFYEIWIVPVGGKFAVAHLGKRNTVKGRTGWLIKNLIDLRYFLSILPFRKAVGLLKKDIILFAKND